MMDGRGRGYRREGREEKEERRRKRGEGREEKEERRRKRGEGREEEEERRRKRGEGREEKEERRRKRGKGREEKEERNKGREEKGGKEGRDQFGGERYSVPIISTVPTGVSTKVFSSFKRVTPVSRRASSTVSIHS
jgi:hypothetical protein